MPNSHCVTPAAVIVKKFFMILQMTIFLFFFFCCCFFLLYQQENGSEIGYSTHFSRVLKEHFCFADTALTRTMLLPSSDRWKYLHFAAGRFCTHSPLHYTYGTRVQGSPWRKIKKIRTGIQRSKNNNYNMVTRYSRLRHNKYRSHEFL